MVIFISITSTLKALNVAAVFATNFIAVSIPGRLDGQQDGEMCKGNLYPTEPNSDKPREESPLVDENSSSAYTLSRSRTLINPSGWAFTVWAPIYIGEAAFVTVQMLATNTVILPQITAPFVAANIFQSLWCASFRPSYGEGWRKYISVAMLAGTAFSLGLVHTAGCKAIVADISIPSYILLPMTVHFGRTSATTLVNLNGSFASDSSISPRMLTALGHSSSVAAAALGVGVTLAKSSPSYGLTLAWALAACADGVTKRVPARFMTEEDVLRTAAVVQKKLCWVGSFACAIAAAYVGLL